MAQVSISNDHSIIVHPLRDLHKTLSIGDVNMKGMFNYICLLIITDGQCSHLIDENLYELKAGHVAMIMPEQSQAFQVSRHLEGYFIAYEKLTFSCSSLYPLMPDFDLYDRVLKDPIHYCEPESLSLLITMCQTLMGIMGNNDLLDGRLAIAANQLKTILSMIDTFEVADPLPLLSEGHSQFLTFKSLLNANIHSMKATKDYAELMAITPKKLNTITREAIGVTAKDLINERLLIEVKKGLLRPNLSIEDISESLGFQTPSYLTRYFKHHTGITPLHFRKTHEKF